MLQFFADRSGVPYPGDGYSQILVPEKAGGRDLAAFFAEWVYQVR